MKRKKNEILELGLYDQIQNKNELESVYLYTNINNLRHFTSLDAVVAHKYFQTDIYTESFGSIFPFYLLLTTKPISQNILGQFNFDVNPVILEFDLRDIPFENCLFLNSEYLITQLSYDKAELKRDTLLLVPGYIPMCLVKKIIFQSETELRDFKATKFRSMESDYSKFYYNSTSFNGDYKPELKKLYELASTTTIENQKELIYTLHRRDRLRGSLLAASGDYEINLSDNLSVNFDCDFLNLCANLTKNYDYNLNNEFKEINLFLESWSRNKGMLVEMDFSKMPKDPTPFSNLVKWPFSNHNHFNVDLTLEKICDIYAYELILLKLIDSDSQSFKPIDFINNFINEFGNKALSIIPSSYVADFDHLYGRYKKASEHIKLVIEQKEKAIDVLKRYPSEFNTLKTFMVFASKYSADSYMDLINKLGKFNLTPFEKRMVLSMYGMLNGVSPLGESLKRRKDLLIITELIAQQNEINKAFPNFSSILERKLSNKSSYNINNDSGTDEVTYSKVVISSLIGLDLTIKITDSIEPIRSLVISQLNSSDIEEIKNNILLHLHIPDVYIAYETEFEDKAYKVEITLKGFRIRHSKKVITSKKVWDKWDLYKKEVIENRTSFHSLPKEEIELLKKIVMREKLPDPHLSESKKKRSNKKSKLNK